MVTATAVCATQHGLPYYTCPLFYMNHRVRKLILLPTEQVQLILEQGSGGGKRSTENLGGRKGNGN